MNLWDGLLVTDNTTVMAQNAEEFEAVLSTVHPITFSCYYAQFEY